VVQHLANGKTKSCGCFRKESVTKHGQYRSVEYAAWRNILSRCDNPKDKRYANYGGRGIQVCERWKSFENFLSDMGTRPGLNYSIERIDNGGHYEPGNCKWATIAEQSRNKRSTVFMTIDGRTMIAADWARETGTPYRTLLSRIKAGWTDEDAVRIPVSAVMGPRAARLHATI
jgi:hypothetical protein